MIVFYGGKFEKRIKPKKFQCFYIKVCGTLSIKLKKKEELNMFNVLEWRSLLLNKCTCKAKLCPGEI